MRLLTQPGSMCKKRLWKCLNPCTRNKDQEGKLQVQAWIGVSLRQIYCIRKYKSLITLQLTINNHNHSSLNEIIEVLLKRDKWLRQWIRQWMLVSSRHINQMIWWIKHLRKTSMIIDQIKNLYIEKNLLSTYDYFIQSLIVNCFFIVLKDIVNIFFYFNIIN
jgi:hypothetical protein